MDQLKGGEMAENRFNFTVKSIQSVEPPPKGKRSYFYDKKTRGLLLAVTPTGAKSFYVYRKVQGRPERILIGKFPDVSIENARKAAEKINATIAEGRNPADVKRAAKEELTLAQFFEEYLTNH